MKLDGSWLNDLASNGPWALMAGVLLYYIIKSWTQDRAQVTALLGEFRHALDRLTDAVESLHDKMKQ